MLLVTALHLLLISLVLARVGELHILEHEPRHGELQLIGLVHLLLHLLAQLGQLRNAVLRAGYLLSPSLAKTYLGCLACAC